MTGTLNTFVQEKEDANVDVFGASLSRRGFVGAGGALLATLVLVRSISAQEEAPAGRNVPTSKVSADSFIEIRADNTILIRTGKSDFGQSTVFTAYRQIVADELYVPFEAITTVISGDTDRTPDGGGTFDLLGHGMPNIRKAGAYVYQALLDVASKRLNVPKAQLSVKDGVVSGGGKSISYGDLVKDQQLHLTIPVRGDIHTMFGLTVAGNPPLKPVSQYTVVGKSFTNSAVVPKVLAKETWVTDVRLPGMLHGRVIHPRTLGSKLISAGALDKSRYPNSQIVIKGNLVAVVAPTEWEAIKASRQVAANTRWSDWQGLPADTRLFNFLKEDADWKSVPAATSKESKGDVPAALASSPKKLKATYERPYLKHAPIGPTMAVGDVRPDGSIHLHAHTQNPQALRTQIALMLGVSPDKVTVHTYAGAGHYGRSNGGNAGAEDEAVILSQAVGKPVRVQWMRNDDLQWSTQSSCAFSEVELSVGPDGKLTGYQIDHFMPAMQDDRPIGAILAGLPTMAAPNEKGSLFGMGNQPSDPWLYGTTPAIMERAHGGPQIGQVSSPINVGLRDHSLRTPVQYQQNFPRELAITEAAYLAGVDPLQFRINHATEKRTIAVLESARESSGWQTRSGFANGSGPIKQGQGVSLMMRGGAYWACVAQLTVDTNTGVIKVDKVTMVVDPGIVINPLQLKRQIEGGTVMGISMTLHEELSFNESTITSSDWISYPIATMAELPEIKVVLHHHPEVGSYSQGSEAANALAAPAIAAAFFDATGKVARRLPLKPAYVKDLLKA
jgi:CO/xanthine dehydrogenase Mo-binding subunit